MCCRKVAPLKLSAVLHHCPSLWDDKKCSVVNKLITELDKVPDSAQNIQVPVWLLICSAVLLSRAGSELTLPVQALYISKNFLLSLDGLQHLSGLKKLSAADNCLADFAALDALQAHAQTLQAVNLEGNPLALLPNYRAQVRLRGITHMAGPGCN